MIDWDRFAAKVPAGTIVRCRIEDYTSDRGIILENYPYKEDEYRAGFKALPAVIASPTLLDVSNYPALRTQWFDTPDESHILANSHVIQYLIDGAWVTFDQLMTED